MSILGDLIDTLLPTAASMDRRCCRTCEEGSATIRFRDGSNAAGETVMVFELTEGRKKVCVDCLSSVIKELIENPKRKWSVGPSGLSFTAAGKSWDDRPFRIRPAAWRLVRPVIWRDWDSIELKTQLVLTKIRKAMAKK